MKYLLAACALLLAANAFASKPDSGICPWKMPFTISISGTGKAYCYGDTRNSAKGGYVDHDTNYWNPSSTDNFQITIDSNALDYSIPTHHIQYSLLSDTLRFTTLYDTSSIGSANRGAYGFESIVIAFAPGADSIISITIGQVDSDATFAGVTGSVHYFRHFQISSLLFDDSSIYTTDSSFLYHNISMADTNFHSSYYDRYNYNYLYTNFTASSVTLSGFFRTTTFSDPSAAVAAPIPNTLSIFNFNGSIACSFDQAKRERNLEIYSPLGMKVAGVTIPAGNSQASLPKLNPGIYFVRLEGDVRKIYVPD